MDAAGVSQAGEEPSERVEFETPPSPKKEVLNGSTPNDGLISKQAPSGPAIVPVRVFRDEAVILQLLLIPVYTDAKREAPC